MEPDIDKIEAYLSGAMTGAQRQAFEAEMAAQPALAREVDAFRLAREAVELSISDRLRNQFQDWGEERNAQGDQAEAKVLKLNPQTGIRRLLAIAASVLFLLGAGSLWFVHDQYAAGAIAVNAYKALPLDLSVRGAADPMATAVANVRAGNFSEADAFFRSIPEGDDQYYDARYYLGHSLFQQRRYGEAVETLQLLESTSNQNLREDAEWLQILSYLQNDQTDSSEFQGLLSKIINDEGHAHYREAVNLDQRLDSFWYNLVN